MHRLELIHRQRLLQRETEIASAVVEAALRAGTLGMLPGDSERRHRWARVARIARRVARLIR